MFPTLIHVGGFHLASYGVLVAAGFLAGIWYLSKSPEVKAIGEENFQRLITGIFLSGMGGGKALYLLLYWREMDWSLGSLIGDLRFGFVYFGGFIGAVLWGIYFTRRHKFDFWKLSDPAAPALALGHGIGRLGCFAAGCCFGLPTTLPWGIRFHNPEALIPSNFLGVPLHPTQLYESAGDIALAAALHFLLLPRIRSGKLREGTAFLAYGLGYSFLRFLVELVRGDDRGFYALGLSISQWVGLGLVIVTGGVLAYRQGRHHAA